MACPDNVLHDVLAAFEFISIGVIPMQVDIVSLPIGTVLKPFASSVVPGVQYVLHLPFIFVFNDYRAWRLIALSL